MVDFNLLGLNLIVNMRSLVNLGIATTPDIPYNVKISTKSDMIDQKRGVIELRPGYHLIIRVVPKVVDTSEDFENFDVNTRDCKLPHETNEGGFFQNYTKYGCELECALNHSLEICKCKPWYLPNDFKEMPMCDMFGAKCSDMVLSDETYYKDCSKQCLRSCKSTSYTAVPSYLPIKTEEICAQPNFKDLFEKLYTNQRDYIGFDLMTTGNWKNFGNWRNMQGSIEYCKDYVKKYVAIVTVETPVDTVIKSKRIARISFNDQLAVVGGTLGLFTGISILSMVEVLCFCLTLTKRMCLIGKDKICKKKDTFRKSEKEGNEERGQTNVREFVAKTIQRATNKSSLTYGNEMTKIS